MITSKLKAAFALLDLPLDAKVAELEARWKRLRSGAHPDKGGDGDRFHALRQAYELAREYLLEPKACPGCEGTGSVRYGSTACFVLKRCPDCAGTGQRTESPEEFF